MALFPISHSPSFFTRFAVECYLKTALQCFNCQCCILHTRRAGEGWGGAPILLVYVCGAGTQQVTVIFS